MSVTIHDLAKLSGLNASTISRALRNDPRVRKTTRELVRKLARKHGYAPNLPARQLAAGKTGNIWFCFGSPEAAVELETAIKLDEFVTREHHDLLLVLHGNSTERLEHLLEKLCQQVADGALAITTEPGTDLWQRTYYHFRNDNAPVLQLEIAERLFD